MVWLARWAKPLSRIHLCRYEEWHPGQPLKILLVGYNGARNTGADARVVALTQQLEQVLGTEQAQLTVMTLDTENVRGYFSKHVRLFHFTTLFPLALLRAASRHHVAILCEGSTLTPTFAKALCIFFCEAAGIMRSQGKPCIAYGSEIGKLDGWLAQLSRELCSDTYFIVRSEESLSNLQALGLQGHVGTDTAWTFQAGEDFSAHTEWAEAHLRQAGWDGRQPLMGVAVLNPFCWPVSPSLSQWLKAHLKRDFSLQYDKLYFFADSEGRRQRFHDYIQAMAAATNRYQQEHHAFVVVFGMEQLDGDVCRLFEQQVRGPHTVCTSETYNVFQMTALLRHQNVLLTSRYHAAVLSMEQAIPIVAVSIDNRLDGLMREVGLSGQFLHHASDSHLETRITTSLNQTVEHKREINESIRRHLGIYKEKVKEMSQFFMSWQKEQFS